jgi:hypothetical protein
MVITIAENGKKTNFMVIAHMSTISVTFLKGKLLMVKNMVGVNIHI